MRIDEAGQNYGVAKIFDQRLRKGCNHDSPIAHGSDRRIVDYNCTIIDWRRGDRKDPAS